jgi:beta-N-acetylhexosaminidase
MDTVEARINRGEIPMSRLDDAVKRVWAMRERFNFIKKSDSLFTEMTQADKDLVFETGSKLAEKAVTLLEDRNNDIPLTAEKCKKILLMPISYEDKGKTFEFTKKELEKRGFEVDMLVSPHFYQWGWRIDSLYTYDKVFICFENRYFHPIGTPFFKDHEAFGVWTANMLDPNKRIAVSYSNPFLVNFYEEIASMKVNAYSCDSFSQRAVVKALCGEIPFTGKSPVKLNPEELK